MGLTGRTQRQGCGWGGNPSSRTSCGRSRLGFVWLDLVHPISDGCLGPNGHHGLAASVGVARVHRPAGDKGVSTLGPLGHREGLREVRGTWRTRSWAQQWRRGARGQPSATGWLGGGTTLLRRAIAPNREQIKDKLGTGKVGYLERRFWDPWTVTGTRRGLGLMAATLRLRGEATVSTGRENQRGRE
jgi:hypothetical protein